MKFTGHNNGVINCFKILVITYSGNRPVTNILTNVFVRNVIAILGDG